MPTEPEKEAARKKALDEELKRDVLKRLNTGVSSGGYLYLSAAKVISPIVGWKREIVEGKNPAGSQWR
jgi:hypothetical protein